MKKLASILAVLLLAAAMFAGCTASPEKEPETPDPGGNPPKPPAYEGTQIFADADFQKGFNLMGTDSASQGTTVYKKIRYGTTLGTPQWKLAQWWSVNDLSKGEELSTLSQYRLKDASKALHVNLSDDEVTLEVNASKEFSSAQTSVPSKWPHLLVEQSLSEPIPIKDAKRLDAVLDFRIDKSINGGAGNFHAQYAWFIYAVDKNPASPGYGNFLWFGLNLFNSALDFAPPTHSQDTAGGLGNFIYTVGAEETMGVKMETGKTMKARLDLVPAIKDALACAAENGFMIGTAYDDLSITGMNLGWEVFDRWDVSATIEDLGLYFVR